jgi:nitroimidazol reductase NimA-like FMN-containing flavoprotein (pyridoxamine 5'-phosphate oxidase superfamily)
MSAYGTDSPDWQALPWEWAGERLTANHNYWLITVSEAGAPHALPVWGVWDDTDLQFMFSCAPMAQKARNIRGNPHVAFTVDSTVECVSVQGVATLLSDPARIDTWVDRYVVKYGPESPEGLGDFVRQHAVFEVSPTVAHAIIERETEFALRATRWRFA